MKRFITRVSVTGADDSTDLGALEELGSRFPFLEFALLFSHKRAGSSRYPSRDYLEALLETLLPRTNSLALHLCGSSVADFVNCDSDRSHDLRGLVNQFDRVQLNFSQKRSGFSLEKLIVATCCRPKVIIQEHGGNEGLLEQLHHELLLRGCSKKWFQLLFDGSGGNGVSPSNWPKAVPGISCGYAGGLTPDNLPEALPQIAAASAGRRVWIDAESGLRTNELFDLAKVERFAKIAAPYIIKPRGSYGG